ncbi:hypothetical protein CEXT_320441 [Caerostris extrusa]|uniref:Uncharacterized protein n=1 Tax=Caerostris extrusa TaxID=172846 RepID=A0AAV4UB66_CAEEX|nr:hypothetical protein CEXT_320441 [Caerostris extrusa]
MLFLIRGSRTRGSVTRSSEGVKTMSRSRLQELYGVDLRLRTRKRQCVGEGDNVHPVADVHQFSTKKVKKCYDSSFRF